MSIDQRLNSLTPTLTARERAILVLRAWKDGKTENPRWRRTMPQEQIAEFNRYISLMNAANVRLPRLMSFLEHEVDKLRLRLSWLFCLGLWHLNLAEIDFAAALVAHETITESEHHHLVEQHKDDYVRVQDLAYLLAEERRAWRDEDLESEDGWQELIVKPAVWKRLCKEAEAELRAAVEAGQLQARRTKSGLAVKRSDFDAWLGRPVTLQPEWAAHYHVVPDSLNANAQADRNTLGYLWEAIQQTPLGRLGALAPEAEVNLKLLIDGLSSATSDIVEARWTEMRGVEVMIERIAAAFGEDPLLPDHRESLDAVLAGLASACRELQSYGLEVAQEEPSQDYLEKLKDWLERDGKLFS